jgi:transposase
MPTLIDLFARDGLEVASITEEEGTIVVYARSSAEAALCPSCHTKPQRVHSRYMRSLKDLPAVGSRLTIRLKARKFFCDNKKCRRRVFSERLPRLADLHARSTKRLNLALCEIGHAVGAEGGARLAQALGMPTSGDTVLRRVRTAPMPRVRLAHVIGVDDWAYKKGQTYGTIICDLERRCPIDLLPDRESESLSNWLRNHSEVQVVSRDRSGAYANGIEDGAPEAIQVADRWHLLKNARDVLKRIADRCHQEVRKAAEITAKKQLKCEDHDIAPHPESGPSEKPRGALTRENPRREKRWMQYHAVQRFHQQGLSQREIAIRVGLDRSTVQRFIHSKGFPERAASRRECAVDKHYQYLQRRWRDGCQNASQLYRELMQEGFRGSYYAVRRYVKSWRPNVNSSNCRHLKFRSPSSSRVAWLLLTEEDDLAEKDRAFVQELRTSCRLLRSAANVLRDFTAIVRQQKVERWTQWIARASHSCESPEIRGFAESLKSDEAAVRAALTYPWSNGPVEGHVNRLKTLKRQMYGRANFDLLRRRVLRSTS